MINEWPMVNIQIFNAIVWSRYNQTVKIPFKLVVADKILTIKWLKTYSRKSNEFLFKNHFFPAFMGINGLWTTCEGSDYLLGSKDTCSNRVTNFVNTCACTSFNKYMKTFFVYIIPVWYNFIINGEKDLWGKLTYFLVSPISCFLVFK